MATFVTNRAAKRIASHELDITTGIKIMLCTASFTGDNDTDFVGSAAGTAGATEITCTGYARGFGAAGRKATTTSFTEQDANNRAVVIFTDVVWNPLGGAVNDVARYAIVIKEVSSDADSEVIEVWDLGAGGVPTNGSSFTLGMDATNGNLRLTT